MSHRCDELKQDVIKTPYVVNHLGMVNILLFVDPHKSLNIEFLHRR